MVTILSPGKSIRNNFYYNENKVKDGVARLIHAENYPLGQAVATEASRLNMLLKMAEQNSRAKVNSMHITLNFDPSEKLSEDKLKEITRTYMDKIGFGNQPYLVYQHFDAGHPHVHVVTTNVEATGKLISLHHLGILKSEPARKALEQQYGLVRAEDQQKSSQDLKPAWSAKVIYGRSDSRRAIANVLSAVLDTYRFTSLPELNALLVQYNIKADKGGEESRIYKNSGLVYHILDEEGKPVGVPIKASSFYNKPTLKALQERFVKNASLKVKHKNQMKNSIDLVMAGKGPATLSKLREALKVKGIHTVLRENKDGTVYGLTYVDHNTRCVFNGSELGKAYSAKGILERLDVALPTNKLQPEIQNIIANISSEKGQTNASDNEPDDQTITMTGKNLLEELMQNESNKDFAPFELRGKKKKKKKRKSI